jgi:Leucine-rich repeat (LRR) protein
MKVDSFNFNYDLGKNDLDVLILEMWFSNATTLTPIANQFPNLTRINFVGNRIDNISLSTFKGLSHLQKLMVTKTVTKWHSIQNEIFKDLFMLESLYLSYNMIETIEAEAFESLRKLKELALINNILASLPNGLFKNNKNLNKINLENNHLKYIPANLFDDLTISVIKIENDCCIDLNFDDTSNK